MQHQPRHDKEAMRSALETWLARQLPGASEVTLSSLRLPNGTGNSAETTFGDLRYRDGGETFTRKIVIRRQLSGTDLFLEADIRLPYNMMKALEGIGSVPSARTLGVETDTRVIGSPFLVMEVAEGRVVDQVPNYNVQGWLADLLPAQRRETWLAGISVMAELHNLDWRERFAFLDDHKRGAPGLDQFLQWSIDWYRWARADRELTVADAALAYLVRNRPETSETCVLWGDPTPANTLFSPDGRVAAILDFEMSALGPGETDLTWWLGCEDNFSTLQGIPRLEGLPSREEIISLYEEKRGRKVQNLDYYMMLTWFRMNIVAIRFADRLVAEGRLPDGTDVLTHNSATMLMARFLGLPDCPPGEGVMLMAKGMAGAG